jgi:hypothetical protein
MSTKNLARTIIEGGRYWGNRWDRRESNAAQRTKERAILRGAPLEDDIEGLVMPRRKKVERAFADKLGAPRRWLERQVGRPWNVVRSELLGRVDTRTTAGRHIVFDHVLRWVEADRHCFGRRRFRIDGRGILRRAARES